MIAGSESRTLIDDLLSEQRRMTPVERFSERRKRGALPAQERYYRSLIPETGPGLGQQYAFAVDLDVCSGCKACVAACHSLNGLDDDEMWRDVGLIHGTRAGTSYQQTVTTACHHCVEPGCLEGCPVLAYEKDEVTGIVRHLDDQCIGCQYCVLKCPYDVPKYSSRLGIVRKCDMCVDRLRAGEAPACVQACPHEAIRITLVDREETVSRARPGSQMLPGAFDSSYTKPTTQYTSRREIPKGARAIDAEVFRHEHAHFPLIVMLLLTQLSVGAFLAAIFSPHSQLLTWLGWMALHAGLGASIFHLGRPFGAWRFFLGLRTSWMSREILAFSVLSAIATGAVWLPVLPSFARGYLPFTIPVWIVATVGLLAVYTSAMIYVDTRRPDWRAALTFPRFMGSVLLFAITSAWHPIALVTTAGLVFVERYFFFTRCRALRMPGSYL